MDTYEELLFWHIKNNLGLSSRPMSNRSMFECSSFFTLFTVLNKNPNRLKILDDKSIRYSTKESDGCYLFYVYIDNINQIPEIKEVQIFLKLFNPTRFVVMYNIDNLPNAIPIDSIEGIIF